MRRPIAARDSGWAGQTARALAARGIAPNTVSGASVVFAAAAAACLAGAPWVGNPWAQAALFGCAAAGVQLRLLCNLFDGMLAVEFGKGSALGPIWNDLPDRPADVLILAACGFAGGPSWLPIAGGLAAVGALMTAYVRVLGAAIGARETFAGPMAKQQRMALVTIACALAALESVVGWPHRAMAVGRPRRYRRRLRADGGAAPEADRRRLKSQMKTQWLGDALAGAARLVSGAAVRLESPRALGEGQRVYLANHSSHLDFIVLWAALPPELRRRTRPVAAKDYWEKTALRRYLALEIYRAILIEREHVSAHNNPIVQIAEAMGETDSVILFPEGTRGSGEAMGAFKSGIYHLAHRKPELECVPVYLENLNRVLPKGEFLPLPILSSIALGEPLRLQAGEAKAAFLERLRAAVAALGGDNAECR